MQIKLASPIAQPSRDITALEVFSVTDKAGAKTVTAEVSIENVGMRTLTLWEGEAYDEIGQWKDQDVIERVTALVRDLFKS